MFTNGVLLTLKLKNRMKIKTNTIKSYTILWHSVKKPMLILSFFILAACETVNSAQSPEQPLDETRLIALGDRANESGDWKTAVTFYQQAHLTAPESTKPLLAMATTLDNAGSYENAARVYYQLARSSAGEKKTTYLLSCGQAWLKAGEAEQAIAVLNEASVLAPDEPVISVGLGIAHDLKSEFATAQAIYQEALKKHPGQKALMNNLGLSYLFTGDTDLAIRQLALLGKSRDASRQHRFNLAMAYGIAGRMADAERMLREMGDDANVERNLDAFVRLRGMTPEERASVVYDSQIGGNPQASK